VELPQVVADFSQRDAFEIKVKRERNSLRAKLQLLEVSVVNELPLARFAVVVLLAVLRAVFDDFKRVAELAGHYFVLFDFPSY
jgi:hypothetical protein